MPAVADCQVAREARVPDAVDLAVRGVPTTPAMSIGGRVIGEVVGGTGDGTPVAGLTQLVTTDGWRIARGGYLRCRTPSFTPRGYLSPASLAYGASGHRSNMAEFSSSRRRNIHRREDENLVSGYQR
jgi:hypothetical protein